LVIGQWISLIDKIARKPTGTSKPTPEQRRFRHRLGAACGALLKEGKRRYLPNISEAEESELFALWWSRIHPYPEGVRYDGRTRAGALQGWAKVEGRLYKEFAGSVAPDDADAKEVAKKIEAKLYGIGARMGLIEARAQSIRGNVPHMRRADELKPQWPPSPDDVATYTKLVDPVTLIHSRAKEIERAGGRMSHREAAILLHKHWAKVFRGEGDTILSVVQARDKCQGLLDLHDALRLCYRGLLKRTLKDTREQRNEADMKGKVSLKLSILLPRNLQEAQDLIERRRGNTQLAGLVRLGKIIHYSAPRGTGNADHPAHAIEHWPQGWTDKHVSSGRWLRDIKTSDEWTSDGQAKTKRAEAFVRLWRQALVLARWTLTDWVSMKETFPEDILGGGGQPKKALDPEKFERGAFDDKLRMLFGLRAATFAFDDDGQRREFLGGLIEATAELRHAAFHFKGRQDLLKALERLPHAIKSGARDERNECVMAAAASLWEADGRGRIERLRETLVGAHAEDHLTQDQGDQIMPFLAKAKAAELPLPRFSRILVRKQNARPDGQVVMPSPAKRIDLEARPDRRCQYTIIKLVYERPFRAWLEARTAVDLQAWIERAVKRANRAAQELHGKGKTHEAMTLIVARANRLKNLADATDARGAMVGFVAELSRDSASEMRIQRGYESDAEKAREQAEYIEDLLCDVTLLAFDRYLGEAGLDWLRKPPQKLATRCDLPNIVPTDADIAGTDWQKALYLILHLIPVESVGQLKHQLARWEIAAGGRNEAISKAERGRLDSLFAAMNLYLDMHDAKFTGDMALGGCEDFKRLFDSGEKGFQKVFPKTRNRDEKTERRLPRRGLREIARFGHLPVIETLCGGAKIKDDAIERVVTMEDAQAGQASEIAKWHGVREGLHKKLARLKKFDTVMHEVKRYADAVATIAAHREASNFINLVDHVRVHRIVMAVWSRLVDYAGLFERDLYFVTLALLHESTMAPADLLLPKGIDFLKMGQTITALGPTFHGKRIREDTEQAEKLFAVINELFGDVWESAAKLMAVRNRLAHLDLRGWKNSKAAPAPQLSERINDARRLMAYDRKMKNAVTKSVIELMQREGVDLVWSIPEGQAGHGLTQARLSPRTIQHLGGVRVPVRGGDPEKGEALNERLVSDACVKMLAAAFGGSASQTESIIEIIDRIDLDGDPLQSPSSAR
jgi:hypothetical protein